MWRCLLFVVGFLYAVADFGVWCFLLSYSVVCCCCLLSGVVVCWCASMLVVVCWFCWCVVVVVACLRLLMFAVVC